MFPDQDTKKNYENNQIEKCFLFQNLIETDSTSVFFIFVANFHVQSMKKKQEI